MAAAATAVAVEVVVGVAAVAVGAVAADPTTALGLGLLWRPELAALARREIAAGRLGFVEVIAESVGPVLPDELARADAGAGATVVPHGVALGLGGASPPDRRRLARFADVAERCGAPLVSEHIAFVRAAGVEAGHLLPVPRTREALDVLVANVRTASDHLPVPLALEPIATLVEWPDNELTELAFLVELLERTDADLVLDVANILVNAANRRRHPDASGPDTDPLALVSGLPPERIAYVHAAGGRIVDGRHHDTHTDPLWPEVETLVEELWSRHEIPGLLLERDGAFPDDAELVDELSRLAAAAARGRARRTTESRPRTVAVRPAATPRRDRLAAAQAGFVSAVTGSGDPLPGFDEDDLAAVALVLARKRAAAVAHAVPDVAALPAFAERFVAWARSHPNRGGGGSSDAIGFLRSLPHTERTVHACLAVAAIQVRRRPGVHLWRNHETVVLALGRSVRAL